MARRIATISSLVLALLAAGATAALATTKLHWREIAVSSTYRPGATTWKFHSRLIRRGKEIGTSGGRCKHTPGAGSNHCTETFGLAHGSIKVRLTFTFATSRGSGKVIGDSGAYKGDAGRISIREITQSTLVETVTLH